MEGTTPVKMTRRYQTIPDRARCYRPGCAFHMEGATAETLGEAHAGVTGHEVRVESGSVIIFTHHRMTTVAAK
jgi:hypothetical protein